MNKTEFLELLSKAGTNLDGKSILYTVGCRDCIAYTETNSGPIKGGVEVRGRMDGREYEFKSLEAAQAEIDLHRKNKPLHNPYVSSKPIMEYLIHMDKYMMRYRQTDTGEDTIRIHSVNGHTIAPDKCAYICQLCGAIYQSKDYNGYTLFDTTDPRCQMETHGLQKLEKICLCHTIFEEREEHEEQQTKRKSIEWWNTHPNECHVCHKPFFAPGHVYETFNPTAIDRKKRNRNYKRLERRTKYWHLFGAYDDAEHGSYIPVQNKLVCEDCYHTSPQYKDRAPPLDKKRYLARKRARKQTKQKISDF